MLKNILFVLVALGLVSALAAREWLIYKEIEVKQTEISDQLQRSLASARDLEELQALQSSELVYSRYLDPIVFTASRLLLPNLRAEVVQKWERKLHQALTEEIRARSMKMEEGTEASIKQAQQTAPAGHDRLLTVARLSQGLLSTLARIDLIENEVEAIETQIKKNDSEKIAELKSVGIEKLKALKAKIAKMDEVQISEYLSSRAFSREALNPVMDIIFEIEQQNLRKATWKQFEKKLFQILGRQSKLLAQRRESDNEAVHSIAELLKKEFEKDQKAKSAQQRLSPPPSPADSLLYQ